MKIIEEYRNSKTGNLEECEDMFVMNENFALLVDGMTSKLKRKWNGKKGGRIAAELICTSLLEIKPDSTIEIITQTFTNKIAEFYKSENIFDTMKVDPSKRIAASFVIYSKFHSKIWMVGDCQCMIDGKLFTHEKEIDRILAEARSVFLESEILNGKTIKELRKDDAGRKFIMPLLLKQQNFQNINKNSYAYDVIDGFPVNLDLIKEINVDKTSEIIILASDGYPEIKSNLKSSEENLQEILNDDPLCFRRFKSTKGFIETQISFDDRSYLKFSIEYHKI